MMGGILEMTDTGTERRGTSYDRPLSASYIFALHIPTAGGLLSLTPAGSNAIVQNTEPGGELHLLGPSGGIVVDGDGDMSPDSPNVRKCGQENFEWAEVATYVLNLKPGGSGVKQGDVVIEDTGLSERLRWWDNYGGGLKTAWANDDPLAGDLSGSLDSPSVMQVDCPSSEQFPVIASKLQVWVDEGGLGDGVLYFTYLSTDGLTQLYASLPLTKV